MQVKVGPTVRSGESAEGGLFLGRASDVDVVVGPGLLRIVMTWHDVVVVVERGGPGGGGGENAAVGDVEGRWGPREVDPGGHGGGRSEEVRRRSEGRHDGVARVGSGARGVQLRSLQLLPLLLVRVLVTAQGLRVGELAEAVLALVLPLSSSAAGAGVRRDGAGIFVGGGGA